MCHAHHNPIFAIRTFSAKTNELTGYGAEKGLASIRYDKQYEDGQIKADLSRLLAVGSTEGGI